MDRDTVTAAELTRLGDRAIAELAAIDRRDRRADQTERRRQMAAAVNQSRTTK
jgi:hypothetical protein